MFEHAFDLGSDHDRLQGVAEQVSHHTNAAGMRQLDEFRRIEAQLPGRDAVLEVPRPLDPPLRALRPQELDLLQLVMNLGVTQAVIDKSPATDLEAAQTLVSLISRDYVVVRP